MSGKHDKAAADEQAANLLLTGPIVIRGVGRGVKDALLPGRLSRHRAFLADGTPDHGAPSDGGIEPMALQAMLSSDPTRVGSDVVDDFAIVRADDEFAETAAEEKTIAAKTEAAMEVAVRGPGAPGEGSPGHAVQDSLRHAPPTRRRVVPDVPIVLPSNRPEHRFYRGGRRITDLRGDAPADDHEPEDWVASTTHVFGQPGVGETVLPGGTPLRVAVEADPVGWLGAAHVAAFGADTKLLTKLLDAGQRLPVHAHPDGAFAQSHLGHAHGKAEAWVILRGGTVHLGLRRDVGDEELRALVDAQATAELLDLLHPIEVEAGDAVFVPAGQLHAIGEGVLLLEVQEPEDLSILLEWSGFALDGRADGHLGLGFDTALQAVSHTRVDPEALDALVTRATESGSVLAHAAHPFFSVERVPVDGAVTLPGGYAVVLVERGDVVLGGLPLRRGSTAVVPAGAGDLAATGTGALLVCRPPKP